MWRTSYLLMTLVVYLYQDGMVGRCIMMMQMKMSSAGIFVLNTCVSLPVCLLFGRLDLLGGRTAYY